MTEDLSTIYEEAEKYLRIALSRWSRQLPELWEDAFQEGMIQVWRDVEAGVSPKLKILRRASMAGNKFMHRNGEYYFGKPRKSRDGLSSNTQTLDKIRIFLDEYLPVHNWVYPTVAEVSKRTGIPRAGVGTAMRRIKEGRYDHMVYREDGRMDWNHYSVGSVENLIVDTENRNRHWTDSQDLTHLADTFENDVIENLDLTNLLNQLADGPREILYMYLYEGYTPTEIARYRGFGTNSNSKGSRTLRSALGQVRMLIDPYEGECAKGHARTPETSSVQRRGDGYYIRVCTVCRSVNGGDKSTKAKKMGRQVKTVCPKGHVKDSQDSHGRLRCTTCRAEAQRRYTAKQRAKDAN